MESFTTFMTVVFLSAVIGLGAEPNLKNVENEGEQGITVVIDTKVPGKGLRVFAPKQISASGKKHETVLFTVMNLLEEEVFLTVQGLEFTAIGYTIEKEDKDDLVKFEVGGGLGVFFPDNTGLLKRLHACAYDETGKARPCGCSIAGIVGTIGGSDDDDLDLSKWVGAKCTVTLPIKGYFRANGKEFSTSVEMPIRIVK